MNINQRLVNLMKALDYHVPNEGVCWGYIIMRSQAIFCGEFFHFSERLNFIATLSPTILAQYNLLSFDSEVVTDVQRDLMAIKFNPLTAQQKELQKSYKDLLAFLDNLALFHSPRDDRNAAFLIGNAPLYQSNLDQIAVTAASDEMRSRGNIQVLHGLRFIAHSLVYNLNELKLHFEYLKEKLEVIQMINKNDPKLSREVIIILFANDHAITLQYHPAIKQWTIADANALVDKHYTAIHHLAYDIIYSNILLNNGNKKTIKLYTIAILSGDHAQVAAKVGRVDILPVLKQLKFDISNAVPLIDVNSITQKIFNNDVESLKTLLSLGVDGSLFHDTQKQSTLMHFAANFKKFPCLLELIKSSANLTVQNDQGNTIFHDLFTIFNELNNGPSENSLQLFAKEIMEIYVLRQLNIYLFLVQNKEGKTALEIAIEGQNIFLVAMILLHSNWVPLLEIYKKSLLQQHKALTTTIIMAIKHVQDSEKEKMLKKFFSNNQNALFKVLSTPKNVHSHFFSSHKYAGKKLTKDIITIRESFPEYTEGQPIRSSTLKA